MVKDPAITGGDPRAFRWWRLFGLVPFEPAHNHLDPYLLTADIQWTIDAGLGSAGGEPDK